MIQKYKEVLISDLKVIGGALHPDPQGKWVKWEDVEKYIENIRDHIEDNFQPKIPSSDKTKECDCARMMALMKTTAEEGFSLKYTVRDKYNMEVANKQEGWWICPVHGYKKR